MSVRDFASRPDGATADSDEFMGHIDAITARQNIDLQLELTSPAAADELLIFDASVGKTFKVTLANLKIWLALP